MMYVKGLVPEDRRRWVPELQTLMSGIDFGESPRWHENRLWFSDWGTQEIIAVDLGVRARSSSAYRRSHSASTGCQIGAC